jgi:exodeoxyribonuclease V gamma subunit
MPTPPSGLTACIAPRLAPLRDHLIERLRRAPLPPRQDESIVVQSQGMREWLRLQLADAFGCAASVAMSFPASFVQQLSKKLGVQLDGRDVFSREVVAWRVDASLRAVDPAQPEYAALGPYWR